MVSRSSCAAPSLTPSFSPADDKDARRSPFLLFSPFFPRAEGNGTRRGRPPPFPPLFFRFVLFPPSPPCGDQQKRAGFSAFSSFLFLFPFSCIRPRARIGGTVEDEIIFLLLLFFFFSFPLFFSSYSSEGTMKRISSEGSLFDSILPPLPLRPFFFSSPQTGGK